MIANLNEDRVWTDYLRFRKADLSCLFQVLKFSHRVGVQRTG